MARSLGLTSSGAPIDIVERDALYADGEKLRPYYVNVMEMCGQEDFDGQTMNLMWRADAINPRSWATSDRSYSDPSLVCDLHEWR